MAGRAPNRRSKRTTDSIKYVGEVEATRVRNELQAPAGVGVSGSEKVTLANLMLDAGVTVANLPSSPTVRMIAHVTDASSPSIGSTVSGGGAAAALVWYNGSNWTVFAI